MAYDSRKWQRWEQAWEDGITSGNWFPVGDPGDSAAMVITSHRWQLIAAHSSGAALAWDGDRLLFAAGES